MSASAGSDPQGRGLTAAHTVATPDFLTVIRARGRRLAELIRADGAVEGYDDAKHFDLFAVPAADLGALRQLLQRLLYRPDCAVVRGVPIDPNRSVHVRRLAFTDKRTGDAPTLRAAPHKWAALDLDGLPKPETVPADDLLGCAAVAVQRLPDAFRAARCIVFRLADPTASSRAAGCAYGTGWTGPPLTQS